MCAVMAFLVACGGYRYDDKVKFKFSITPFSTAGSKRAFALC